MKKSQWLLPLPTVSLIQKRNLEVKNCQYSLIPQENTRFGRRGTYCIIKKMTKTISFGRREIFVHDAKGLKNFWEKIIETHTQQQQGEDSRLSRSALKKLRREWTQRLEGRIKMLQKPCGEQEGQMSLLSIETFQPIDKTAA